MATRMNAIQAYCPRIKSGSTVDMEDLVEFIARSTGLNESGVRHVLLELRDTVVFFNRRGQPVKLEGLGIYRPTIRLDGSLDVAHRLDAYVRRQLNVPRTFRGEVLNGEYIGLTSADLVDQWNEDHPDDPVV